MKRTISTDKLLTMGLALYADKRSMEKRVRGIFGRARTAGFARILTVLLCLAVFVGGFTTACVPVRELATDSNASEADQDTAGAMPTPAPDLSDEEKIWVIMDEASLHGSHFTISQLRHEQRREHVAPRVEDGYREQRGDWRINENAPEADAREAIAALLPICNALFDKDFSADQMNAVYYRDNSDERADVWRITSNDDVLVAAIEAETLAFISADCVVEPADALHESMLAPASGVRWGSPLDSLDSTSVVERLIKVLGGKPVFTTSRGGSERINEAENRGWNVSQTIAVELEDGRYYLAKHYGDENLTIEAVGVCPDLDCMQEGVYWRADLVMTEEVMALANPQDFRKGQPSAADMPEQAVYDFYKKLLDAANGEGYAERGGYTEPNLTFYEDHSGVRENYWHVEGDEGGPLIFNIAAKSGHMFKLYADCALGRELGLRGTWYENMGGEEYISATKKLFESLFGEGSVADVTTNAVYDWHYCAMSVVMSNGTGYEVVYEDNLIIEITFFVPQEDGKLWSTPNWLADWRYVNTETGETSIMGW